MWDMFFRLFDYCFRVEFFDVCRTFIDQIPA